MRSRVFVHRVGLLRLLHVVFLMPSVAGDALMIARVASTSVAASAVRETVVRVRKCVEASSPVATTAARRSVTRGPVSPVCAPFASRVHVE